MEVLIEYADGTSERVPARLEDDVLWAMGRSHPGILLEREPERCGMASDYFVISMNEVGERQGAITPFPDEDFLSFTWRLVGSEEDECRRKLEAWRKQLGTIFNPYAYGHEYLHEGLLRILSDEEAARYDQDRNCWLTYLAGPELEERPHEDASLTP